MEHDLRAMMRAFIAMLLLAGIGIGLGIAVAIWLGVTVLT